MGRWWLNVVEQESLVTGPFPKTQSKESFWDKTVNKTLTADATGLEREDGKPCACDKVEMQKAGGGGGYIFHM